MGAIRISILTEQIFLNILAVSSSILLPAESRRLQKPKDVMYMTRKLLVLTLACGLFMPLGVAVSARPAQAQAIQEGKPSPTPKPKPKPGPRGEGDGD